MKSIPELSIEVQLLVKQLAAVAVGDVYTHQQMNETCGQDVWRKAQHKVVSARRIVERDYGIIFAAVSGVGLKRLNDAEKIGVVAHGTELIHRKTKRLVRKAGTVDLSQLKPAEVQSFNVHVSQLGAIAAFASHKATKTLALAVEQSGHQLPLQKTLEAFR